MNSPLLIQLSLAILIHCPIHAADAPKPGTPTSRIAGQLRSLDANVLTDDQRRSSASMLRNSVRDRIRAVNQSDREGWAKITNRQDWEKRTAPRLAALRQSLGTFPQPPVDLNEQITRSLKGDGFQIENIVFQSRPGLLVAANLYVPSPRRSMMPGFILVHSHHNPKTQGELQDMGMTWARQDCAVLVMDQLSYGERRQHQAGNRQDYRFRHVNGLQLHVIGDSLMGWMVWDIMRGVDLLLRRPGLDKEKIVLIGAVAGGGDPAAVAAALDPRITCAIPFNFGGPQPETRYPLPDDAEQVFNYLGSGSWESTRNLRLSGSGGFLPWTIVASIAPRRLIYAHEFSWDRERDPVWKRLQRIFAFYDASDGLAFAHGGGLLQGQPPEATHCNNVGAVHRKMIHPALERWLGIPIPQEFQDRRPQEDLACFTPSFTPRPIHELYAEIGSNRVEASRERLRRLGPDEQRTQLRKEWSRLLGEIEPQTPKVQNQKSEQIVVNSESSESSRGASLNLKSTGFSSRQLRQFEVERIVLEPESGIVVPLLLMTPRGGGSNAPVVIGLSQHGKSRFVTERADAIAELLEKGIAVCLPDVRGTGETSPSGSRNYRSEATAVSATEQMLGRTLLGSRLSDLRSVIQYLRTRRDVNPQRIALWGESFAVTNPKGFSDPLIDEGEPPPQSEPLGGLLALFGALFEENVRAVAASGTLAGYQAALRDRFCYIPHDTVVPGALTAGDLADVVAALAPRPVRLARLVDGRNVLMSEEDARRLLRLALDGYQAANDKLLLLPPSEADFAGWLSSALAEH